MTRFVATAALFVVTAFALAAVSASALYALTEPQLREHGSGWPACDPKVKQWSGYFDIPGVKGAKHYFYWAFGPRNGDPKAPVLLWMTGGPGCSSSLALLVENGPCLINETTADLYNNPYSWNSDAYVIYIDQPAGVGFSYAAKPDYDKNEREVSEDMYQFLQAFFKAHTDLQSNDFFIVGESYGGHYAPATAYRINEGNRKGEGAPIRLVGLAVGNGLTDPYTQYASYPDIAGPWCTKTLGKPCVGESSLNSMKSIVPLCQSTIAKCNSGTDVSSNAACIAARMTCNPLVALYRLTGLNVYDIRKQCEGQLCYDFSGVTKFMNRKDVQESLGAEPTTWQNCNMEVNMMFGVDWFKNFNYTIPALLNDSIRVMIYAGDMDYICNWMGNKNWTMAMQWPGQESFVRAPDTPFTSPDGGAGGLIRSVVSAASPLHFSFVQVYNAGHMVPMDQPPTALKMINAFMQNKKLD